MPEATTPCPSCNRAFAKRSMTRHLQSCLGPGDGLHVVVEGRDATEYWLHLSLAPTATLRHVDQTLRDLWLECCGHMSRFEIGGAEYMSQLFDDGAWGPRPKSMAAAVPKVLGPGDRFTYDYDFGSTTRLKGRAIGPIAHSGKGLVQVIARNAPIVWPCSTCGAGATGTCPGCGSLSCDACADGPCECSERWAEPLRVVNSPRMGVCGYGG